MSGTLIAIGVVCLAIGVLTNLVMAETDKPATAGPRSLSRARHLPRHRARRTGPRARRPVAPMPLPAPSGPPPPGAEVTTVVTEPVAEPVGDQPARSPGGESDVPLRWWQRARSASLLLLIDVALGLVAAAVVGTIAVALVQLVRGAVG